MSEEKQQQSEFEDYKAMWYELEKQLSARKNYYLHTAKTLPDAEAITYRSASSVLQTFLDTMHYIKDFADKNGHLNETIYTEATFPNTFLPEEAPPTNLLH